MKRILMLLFNPVGKGTYWRGLGYAQVLARRGYDMTLLAVSRQQKWRFSERMVDGVRLVETPDWLPGTGYDVWDTAARLGWVNGRSYDLIHAFECRPVVIAPALYLQKRHGLPLITDWCDWFGRGGSVEERPNPILRAVLRPVETFFEEHFRSYAQGTTVINHILRQKALGLGLPADKILLLYNGVDVAAIRPQNQLAVRQRLGLPPDAPIVAYTGAIFQRDAELMAAAFDQLHAQNPAVRLLLVGYCNIAVEEMVREKTAVFRTGPVSAAQLADYLAAADLGWLPLRNSGANRGRLPMKLLDFMAAGKPLVVTDVGDQGRLVREKQLGWVAPDKPAQLAQTVLEALANTAVCQQIGQHARRIAETEFTWEVITDQLETFYQQVVGC